MPDLPELQRLFWRALAEQAAAPELARVVAGRPPLGPEERLGIYLGMYRERLTDVLREDFPRLAAHLGADAFGELARAYVGRHPSEHPSVGRVGCVLAEFVASGADPALPPWAADLARLEWTRREVFEAPDAEPLGLEELGRVPPEEWAALPLAAVPSCAVLVTAWPVHVPWRENDPPPLTPARTALRVWRGGFTVYHAVMDAAEEAALSRLRGGTCFADLCEGLESAEQAGALFLRWVEDGLVMRGLHAPSRS